MLASQIEQHGSSGYLNMDQIKAGTDIELGTQKHPHRPPSQRFQHQRESLCIYSKIGQHTEHHIQKLPMDGKVRVERRTDYNKDNLR